SIFLPTVSSRIRSRSRLRGPIRSRTWMWLRRNGSLRNESLAISFTPQNDPVRRVAGSRNRMPGEEGIMLDAVGQAIGQAFSDMSDVLGANVVVLRLVVASVLGAVIGYERERRGKDAGLRTHILVVLGPAIFVLVSATSGMATADVSRVMQGVVAGIGF